jgi:hypothetical protein
MSGLCSPKNIVIVFYLIRDSVIGVVLLFCYYLGYCYEPAVKE